MINHNNIKKNVHELVKMFPHLVDNYNSLVGYYWVMYDHVATAEDYGKATPAESITRNFRLLVSSGQVQLTTKSKNSREEKQKEFKHEFAAIS